MSHTETKNVSCPLVWEFDGQGEWSAISQVMDPDMVDEPIETWQREWCLMWRIQVTEQGQFCPIQTDRLLLMDFIRPERCWCSLDNLQAHIDLVEQHIRGCRTLGDKNDSHVILLSPETYNNRRRSL